VTGVQTCALPISLGWAITELLGRCFALKEGQPADLDWTGDKLVTLQEFFTPREKIRALMGNILFLADSLGVSSCVIEHENDPDNNKRYVDVLNEDVTVLVQHNLDPALGVTREQLRGKINERLFYWDLRIHDTLQNRPTVVHKAYMVGRGLASLRWYFGLQDKILDSGFIETLYNEYVPMLQPYISTFSTGALSNSLELWWKAISSGQVQPGPDGEAPLALQKQADIWYSLLTSERDALSYAPPTTGSRQYIWKVVEVSWPLFLLGGVILILILALLLFVIIPNFSHFNIITKEVAGVVAALTAFGITHDIVNNAGNILQKAVSEATGTFKGSVIDNIRSSTQQQAVNNATLIHPTSVSQNVAQNTKV